MANLTLTFPNPLPTTLAITDEAWYLDVSSGQEVRLGNVTSISGNTIVIELLVGATIPGQSDFIFYIKNPLGHLGQLKGYFAETQFRNNSQKYAEIFSVGSEVFESSK